VPYLNIFPIIKEWTSSIGNSLGSRARFSPVSWYIREREVRLSIRVLAIVSSRLGAYILEVVRRLLIKVK
jgi:hypothetical protein